MWHQVSFRAGHVQLNTQNHSQKDSFKKTLYICWEKNGTSWIKSICMDLDGFLGPHPGRGLEVILTHFGKDCRKIVKEMSTVRWERDNLDAIIILHKKCTWEMNITGGLNILLPVFWAWRKELPKYICNSFKIQDFSFYMHSYTRTTRSEMCQKCNDIIPGWAQTTILLLTAKHTKQ